jgi:hypothetical protein
MGSPLATPTPARAIDLPLPGDGAGPAPATDPLEAFGPLLAAVAQKDRDSDELTADRLEAGQKFLEDFAAACATEVRPAMEAVLERLRQLGGGGLVEEHPGGEARFHNPRLALWMSLKGEIVGEPRLDRYPYLQLEADVEKRKVQVDEGDMWRGAGGHSSGRVGAWDVAELTGDRITKELLAVAGRAAG